MQGDDVERAWLYILRCRDGRYYVGTTRDSVERRLAEHNSARYKGFTAKRRPVELVYAQPFQRITDAIAAERQVKGWRREKKEALIARRFDLLPELARTAVRGGTAEDDPDGAAEYGPRPSTGSG
ncbi:MAG TPA: GIY-YIG nuclease family protein [Azospirillaceae bacterium]|nr:GIY-YIG nuclease family protein [Azospirillaceae bacterium]